MSEWTEAEARSALAYEMRGGEGSTYHLCDCGQRGCRSVQCIECWQCYLKKHFGVTVRETRTTATESQPIPPQIQRTINENLRKGDA